MTAGGGILHIEAPPEQLVVSGGLFHGFQLWVNLPRPTEDDRRPRYQDIRGGEVALLVLAPTAARCVRVIAGELAGHAGPGVDAHADHLVHATVQPGRAAAPAVAAGLQRAGLRARPARGTVGAERPPDPRAASSPCFGAGDAHRRSRADASQDEPQPEPGRAASSAAGRSASRSRAYGPFVMNTRGRAACRRSRTSRPAGWAPSRREPHPGHDVL